ncbi:VOC family protein [Alteromonadaceae bacterium M269]|nr:VOC family protein [Alteromonadaceae bacterium M269]
MKPNPIEESPSTLPFQCRRIGEVVLRISNMDAMIDFYTQALGLKLLRRFDNEVAFLQIGEAPREDVQTLTFFTQSKLSNFQNEDYQGLEPKTTTLHHFAINIAAEDFDLADEHFTKLGVPFSRAVHTWIGWRSIFLQDPEGNTVELVCYDKKYDRGDTYNYDKLYGDPLGEH